MRLTLKLIIGCHSHECRNQNIEKEPSFGIPCIRESLPSCLNMEDIEEPLISAPIEEQFNYI